MPINDALIVFTEKGMYCPQADVYIDPWRSVHKAIITHGHSDHARSGSSHYLCHHQSIPILQRRLGQHSYQGVAYNEKIKINDVVISFHPAGHVLGSSQIRIEHKGKVFVVSGDYKTEFDGISTAFEPVSCHTFITESTFGLPFFQWKPQSEIFKSITSWWMKNKSIGITSVLFAYSLGKAQRIIQHLEESIGPIIVHGAVHTMNEAYQEAGIPMKKTYRVSDVQDPDMFKGAMVIAPSSAENTPWMKRFNPYATAIASGWMAMRGARRWQAADAGFVLSDHADWKGLNDAVKSTGAEEVLVTHGYSDAFSKWLNEQGISARPVQTVFKGETIKEQAETDETQNR